MEKTKDDVMELMMKRMKDKIKDQKYKMTSQRQVVLRAFVESTARHLSAEDVFELVKQTAPDIGLATVYRTLDLFTQMDLLKKLDFDDGCSRYELNDCEEDGHFHHHLICLDCGKGVGMQGRFIGNIGNDFGKEIAFPYGRSPIKSVRLLRRM